MKVWTKQSGRVVEIRDSDGSAEDSERAANEMASHSRGAVVVVASSVIYSVAPAGAAAPLEPAKLAE